MAKARGERSPPSTIHANADGVISPPQPCKGRVYEGLTRGKEPWLLRLLGAPDYVITATEICLLGEVGASCKARKTPPDHEPPPPLGFALSCTWPRIRDTQN